MSPAALPRVIRLKRTDQDGPVLIHVSSHGAREWKLSATENTTVYSRTLRANDMVQFRAPSYKGMDSEWEAIVQHGLLKGPVVVGNDHVINNAEAVANTQITATIDNNSLKLSFRQSFSGITQRLGSIELAPSEEEIDVFEWASLSAQAAQLAVEDTAQLQQKCNDLLEEVERLKEQLTDFVDAKQRHEDELLGKFRELLNAKKLKIRDQQRLLATAKVDPSAVALMKSLRVGSRVGTDMPSRAKRKHSQPEVKEEADGDVSEDGFEAARTPDRSDPEDEVYDGGESGPLVGASNDVDMDEEPGATNAAAASERRESGIEEEETDDEL